MAYSYQQILESQYESKAANRSQALADLEAARLNEDPAGTMDAADRILEIDKSVAALNTIANQYVRSQQQQPRGSKYGLSQDEMEIAHGFASGDRSMSNDEREKTYAENRDRLRHMRATGAYRDDQGRSR